MAYPEPILICICGHLSVHHYPDGCHSCDCVEYKKDEKYD